MTEKRAVSVERVIAASPDAIFDVLADPRRHAEIDGSGSVKKVREGTPERLALGAHFGMDMKIGMPYRVQNEVVEFEEDRKIAWRHLGHHVWRYELEPVAEGTASPRPSTGLTLGRRGHSRLARAPKRNLKAMESTLSCDSRRPSRADYLGAIRIAPSRRIVSPLRYAFSTMCDASLANSSGVPRRFGKARSRRATPCCLGQHPEQRRVHADRARSCTTRMPDGREIARRRQRHADDAALRRRVGELADLAVERGDRRGVDDHAAVPSASGVGLRDLGRLERHHVERADQVDANDPIPLTAHVRRAVLADRAYRDARAGAVDADAQRRHSAAIATPSATCSAFVTSAVKNFVAPPSSLASASPFSALQSRIVTSAPPATQAPDCGLAETRRSPADDRCCSLDIHGAGSLGADVSELRSHPAQKGDQLLVGHRRAPRRADLVVVPDRIAPRRMASWRGSPSVV